MQALWKRITDAVLPELDYQDGGRFTWAGVW